jgi:hypothetical protein
VVKVWGTRGNDYVRSAFVAAAVVVLLAGCAGPIGTGTDTPVATPHPTPSATQTAVPVPSATPNPTPDDPITSTPVETSTPTPTAPPAAVTVQIVNSKFDQPTGSVVATAIVTDRVSNDGLCTLTATQDAKSVDVHTAGVADATVTYCANLTVALPAGASGTWSVTVAYDEADSHGEATSQVVVG